MNDNTNDDINSENDIVSERDNASENDISSKNLEKQYVIDLIPDECEPALSIRKYGETHNIPIIPKDTASALRTVLAIKSPLRILEIGTAIGYSAAVLAETESVKEIITLEKYEPWAEIAKENLKKYNLNDKIKIIMGDARETIPTLSGEFDLIFIDAAKGHYLEFLKLSEKKLKVGGLFICDNVLFKGMLADKTKFVRRKITIVKRLKKFLKFICNSDSLQTSVLSVGDGLSISVKLKEIGDFEEK